jgi:hypothetical protein
MTFLPTAYCRFCGYEVASEGFRYQHEDICPHNPIVAEAVRRVLAELGEHGRAPRLAVYDDYRRASRERHLPSSRSLIRDMGNWGNVCRWAGLGVPWSGNRGKTRAQLLDAQIAATQDEVDAEIAANRIDPTDWLSHGLPYSTVREEVRRVRGRMVLCDVYSLR